MMNQVRLAEKANPAPAPELADGESLVHQPIMKQQVSEAKDGHAQAPGEGELSREPWRAPAPPEDESDGDGRMCHREQVIGFPASAPRASGAMMGAMKDPEPAVPDSSVQEPSPELHENRGGESNEEPEEKEPTHGKCVTKGGAMIPAAKSPWFEAWFGRHVAGRLRNSFTSLRLAGAENVHKAAADRALLFLSNHTSWWDPLVVFHLSYHFFHLDGHAMMDGANLRRLPFFARIGAFGVDLTDPADGARALRYAVGLLDRPRRMVAIFPQGRERPGTARPLGFRPGAAELARLAKRAATLPFALRYEMGAQERPELLVRFGPPIPVERDVARLREAQEEAVTSLLARIDHDLCAEQLDDYIPLFTRPRDDGGLATTALSWLTRGEVPLPEDGSR